MADTVHPVEQIAIAEIIAHRDDDVRRLIFADWLDDHGQPERAKFIRDQISCPGRTYTLLSGSWLRMRLDPEGVPADEVELFRTPSWCDRIVIARGFISEIECTAEDWLAHADALTASQPIERVTLTTRPQVRVINRRSCERTDREARRLILYEEADVGWGTLKPVRLRCQRSIDLLYPSDPSPSHVTYSRELASETMRLHISSLEYLGGEGGWWPQIAFTLPVPGGEDMSSVGAS